MLDMPKTIMLPKEIDTPEQPENPISTYSAAMIRVCRWSNGTIRGRSTSQKPLNGIRLAAVFLPVSSPRFRRKQQKHGE